MINLHIRIPATEKEIKKADKVLSAIKGTISVKQLSKLLKIGKRVIVQDLRSHTIQDGIDGPKEMISVKAQLLISKILE